MYLTLGLILLGIIIFIVARSMKKYDAGPKNVFSDADSSENLNAKDKSQKPKEMNLRYQLLILIALSVVVYMGVHMLLYGGRLDNFSFVYFTGSVAFMIGPPIVISIIPAVIFWLNESRIPPLLAILMWASWIIAAIMSTIGQLGMSFGN